MSGRLYGQVALVTGSSKGIGRAAAIALAGAGAAVVVTGRSAARGPGTFTATVEEIERRGGRAIGVRCDLRDAREVALLVGAAEHAFGRLDVLVNNAGVYGPARPTAAMSIEWWDEVFDTNLRAVFLACRAAIPLLRVRGGSIINLTSLAAEYDFPSGLIDLAYATSKQGVNRLSVALANELRSDDIAVNALSPVRIRSEGAVARWAGSELADYAEPSTIAPVVIFLAAQRASFSGRILRRDEFVDGAYSPGAAPPLAALFPPEQGGASPRPI